MSIEPSYPCTLNVYFNGTLNCKQSMKTIMKYCVPLKYISKTTEHKIPTGKERN